MDAICINQHNIHERNSQVLLMDGIYRKCSKVLVWLGPHDKNFEAAAAFMNSMRDNEQHIEPCSPGHDQICLNGFSSLSAILNKVWWERTWTIQEILLAREADVLCGNIKLPWINLVDALAKAEDHYYLKRCCYDVTRCMECTKHYFSFREHVGGLSEQQKLLKAGQGLGRGLDLTELRDKSYALLGLVHAEQSAKFDPDYLCSIEELCTKTAVCNISYSGSLRSLNYASDRDRAPSKLGLKFPSGLRIGLHTREIGV